MISENMVKALQGGSKIRKMFEEGNRLKKIYGAENVFDFSIGNPDLEPPVEVKEALKEIASADIPGIHGYMSNNGYESTRAAIAKKRSEESGLDIDASAVCMTVGAAAAMNDGLHSLLDPGDEVIVLEKDGQKMRHAHTFVLSGGRSYSTITVSKEGLLYAFNTRNASLDIYLLPER